MRQFGIVQEMKTFTEDSNYIDTTPSGVNMAIGVFCIGYME